MKWCNAMNYLHLYCSFIRKFELRDKTNPLTEFYENHHVFPKSIFGNEGNNRLVKVSYREHFVLHWLLMKGFVKRYGEHHWKAKKMCHAFHRMVYTKTNINHSSLEYSLARKAMKIAKTGTRRPDMIGKKYFGASPETIAKAKLKYRKTRTGMKTNYPKTRKPLSNRTQEVFNKISESRKHTSDKYVKMTEDEFWSWVYSQNKYNRKMKPNSNVTRAFLARGVPLCRYYQESDYGDRWLLTEENFKKFYGS